MGDWSNRRPCGEVRVSHDGLGRSWVGCIAARGHAEGEHVWYTTGSAYILGPERTTGIGSSTWARWVLFRDGRLLTVGVKRGRPGRLVYGNRSYRWHGFATQLNPEHADLFRKAKEMTRVARGVSARGLLTRVGAI